MIRELTYLLACKDVRAQLDLSESALAECLAEHVVSDGVALLLVVALG